jgi:hypothetical protein
MRRSGSPGLPRSPQDNHSTHLGPTTLFEALAVFLKWAGGLLIVERDHAPSRDPLSFPRPAIDASEATAKGQANAKALRLAKPRRTLRACGGPGGGTVGGQRAIVLRGRRVVPCLTFDLQMIT